MARNELVPQDYCNMVISYIMGKGPWPFTVKKVVNYCIKKTEILDDGDEEQIEHIVRKTLETLYDCEYLAKSGGLYMQITPVSNFDGFVFENPKPMGKVSKEMIDRLNEIDERTQYLGDDF